MEAAKGGSCQELESLLAANFALIQYQGQGTNFSFTGHTALHWAAAKGRVRAVCPAAEGAHASLVSSVLFYLRLGTLHLSPSTTVISPT